MRMHSGGYARQSFWPLPKRPAWIRSVKTTTPCIGFCICRTGTVVESIGVFYSRRTDSYGFGTRERCAWVYSATLHRLISNEYANYQRPGYIRTDDEAALIGMAKDLSRIVHDCEKEESRLKSIKNDAFAIIDNAPVVSKSGHSYSITLDETYNIAKATHVYKCVVLCVKEDGWAFVPDIIKASESLENLLYCYTAPFNREFGRPCEKVVTRAEVVCFITARVRARRQCITSSLDDVGVCSDLIGVIVSYLSFENEPFVRDTQKRKPIFDSDDESDDDDDRPTKRQYV